MKTVRSHDESQRQWLTNGRLYVLVLIAATALYWITAQSGPAWQDSGLLQWRVQNGQYDHPLGLALYHPLFIAMGQPLKVFGAQLPDWLNRLSGLGMAVAVANVCLLGVWLTGRQSAGVLAAAMLAVAHTPWWLATITETYTWAVAGLTGELLLAVSLLLRPHGRKLVLLAIVNGLGFSLHNFALLPLPVYLIMVVAMTARRRFSAWWLLPAAMGWIAGAALQLGFIVQAGLAEGWGPAINSAMFGHGYRQDVLNIDIFSIVWSVGYIGLNWPWASLLPVLLGWWLMPRQAGRYIGVLLGAVTLIHILFAIRYSVPDQFMFLLPAHAMFAIGAAVGFGYILSMQRRTRRWMLGVVLASIVATPITYAVMPALLDSLGQEIRPARLPGRHEARYWITPWKMNEYSAEQFAFGALEAMEPDAVILADATSVAPLTLTQSLHDIRPDVLVLAPMEGVWPAKSVLLPQLADRPVYVVTPRAPFVPAWLEGAALMSGQREPFSPAGPVYRANFSIVADAVPPQDAGANGMENANSQDLPE